MSTFEIGTRVRVNTTRLYHGYDLNGSIGTVKTNSWNSSIAVKLDNVNNPRSDRGYYYFDVRELQPVITPDKNNMEEKTMTKITNYLNIATVEFIGANERVRSCANFEPCLDKGDLCVVNCGGLLKLGHVVDISDPTDAAFVDEIVTRVDTLEYDNRVLKRKHAAELKSKMEARAKQLQDIALYQMLAKDDPDMAALLQEYQSIDKV